MKSSAKYIFTLFFLTLSSFSEARLLQIIHTNDLHSYFKGYNGAEDSGGYARVMTKIRELRKEAAAKNIEVLQLDAGDWGEGTTFFLSENGADSIRALEMLGVEVATIGNHDHLVGGKELAAQIRAAGVKTKFTVANVIPTEGMEIGDTITPYVDIDRGGISARIIGLTTNENYFQYSFAPGKILSPNTTAEEQGKKAHKEGRELVIALTHIGQTSDESLARNTSTIDVVIGGHSHTKMTKVEYEKNLNGKNVPIVQAWAHGLGVGSLLIDVNEKGDVSVVEYKLHEISAETLPDPEMVAFVEASSPKRNANLQFPYNEVLGETKTPMTGYIAGKPVLRSSCWGRHMATAARQAVGAGVGIHISHFEGMAKPPGPVTYADIANQFPHFRKYGDQGWEIATVTMSGAKLRVMMYIISRRGYGVTFSGLGYLAPTDNDDKFLELLDEKAVYRIAIPAEVALAIKTSMPGYRKYLQSLRYTGKYYWPVMADYVRRKTPLSCQ